jgi:hypothetical protein
LHNKSNINLDTKQHKIKNDDPQHQKTKWTIFTYSVKETRQITKLFRDTEIRIAFRTRNTIQNTVKPPHKQINIPDEMTTLPTEIHRKDGSNIPYEI